MEHNELLLRTAFCCMACDGSIASEEVEMIKQLSNVNNLFGDISIDYELHRLTHELKLKGKLLLKEYLSTLAGQDLSKEEELAIANVAVQTIRADNNIEYSEIKFFKVIRANLAKVSDEMLIERIEGIDENYLAQDIRTDYIQLHEDYFSSVNLSAIVTDMIE
ncbi:MAG: TerB family tellurite resistance protein [Alloprevotella sp.]|nr:TerB family tellurite resistance protein [Alloprevotella sp.]